MAYPMIETGMICLGESDDKLAGPLVTGVDIDAGFPQPLRIHQRRQLEQHIRFKLRLEQVRGFFIYSRFELLRGSAENAVPRLSPVPVHCENHEKTSSRIGAVKLTVVGICIMILEQMLSVFDRQMIRHRRQHTSLCQKNVEKIMRTVTLVHGTVKPEISDLM